MAWLEYIKVRYNATPNGIRPSGISRCYQFKNTPVSKNSAYVYVIMELL